MQKPNPTSPAFINPSVQTFPQEAEPNFFRPCSTSPKLQLTQLCQLTTNCHICSFVPRGEAHLKSSPLSYQSAAEQIPATLTGMEQLMSFLWPQQPSLSGLLHVLLPLSGTVSESPLPVLGFPPSPAPEQEIAGTSAVRSQFVFQSIPLP